MMSAWDLASCDGFILHLKNHPMTLLLWGLCSCMPSSLSWVWACLDKLPQSAPTRRIHSILSFFAHFFDLWKWNLEFGWAHPWHWAFESSSPPCWSLWLILHQDRRWRRKIDHHLNLHHHHHRPHLLLHLHLRSLRLSLSQLACPSFSFSHYMRELCLCLMKRLLLVALCCELSVVCHLGVLCHSTITKILKRRCGWHTPGRPHHCGDDPHNQCRCVLDGH